ncbi:MAG TPA: gliding motility-associated C-terminal domain-containing protein, partial [Bacteroidia bacterium]|nr:gliding motility-associated C-terminal domain-containing protein [Bacteroidia bacterium]
IYTSGIYEYKKVIYLPLNSCRLHFFWQGESIKGTTERHNLITTGAAHIVPYINAMVDFCHVRINHSPLFENKFPDYIEAGKDFYYDYGVSIEHPEDDSVSIEITPIMTTGGIPLSYNITYDWYKPFRFLGFPNPSRAYPAGLHLDKNCGELRFRPLLVGEGGSMAVKVSHFVKRNGNTYKVAEVMYEHAVYIRSTSTFGTIYFRPVILSSTECVQKAVYPDIVCGINKPRLPPEITICTFDSAFLSIGNDSDYTYQWEKNGIPVPGAVSASYWAKDTGSYRVVVGHKQTGCTKFSRTTRVQFYDGITPVITYDSSRRYCIGDTAFIERENNHYPFMLWKQNGQSFSDDSALFFPVTKTGVYTLDVVNNIGCRVPSNPLKITINLPDATPMLGHIKTNRCGPFTDTLRSLKPLNQYNWQKPIVSTADNFIITSPGTYFLSGIDTNNCPIEDSVEIVQHALPVINLGSDSGICHNAVLNKTFDPTPAVGYRYVWNNNPLDTLDNYTADDSGLYFVLVTDTNNCQASDSVKITRYEEIKVNLGNDTSICFDAVLNKNLTATPALLTGVKYLWNNGDTTHQIFVTDSGNYFVSLTDTNNCFYYDTLKIIRTPEIKINLGNDTSYCFSEPVNRVLMATATYNPTYFYSWNNSTTDTLNIYTATTEGPYFIHIKDGYNCTAVDTVILSRFPNIKFTLGADTTVCDTTSKTLGISPEFINPLWSTGETTHTITVSNDGPYRAQATDTNLCPVTDTVHLAFKYTPEISLPDTALCERDFITLEIQAGYTKYIWSNGENTYSAAIKDTGAVWVRAINECGEDKAETWIKGCRYDPPVIYIPNAFTPNNDWLNNTLNIYTENIRRFDLKMFNRWGQLVFHSQNADAPWDGTYDGQPVPQESYMYIISVMGQNNKLYTFYGNITVLR